MYSKIKYTSLLLIFTSFISTAQNTSQTINLLDENLSQFDIWIGVPHTTVKDLPEGTYQSDNVHKGTALGLNNDIKDVFTVSNENGEIVLNISGEILGCISTKKDYENYHLSTLFKWGEKKWEPRLEDKRDSGILYHCYGEQGAFWKTWKTSLEFQVQETDLGDFIPLGGNTAEPKRGAPITEVRGDLSNAKKYNPNSDSYFEASGYIHADSEHDLPNGEWNHLEIYVLGNTAVHVVNGQVVMVVENAKKDNGEILNIGQIQIQSEAAECYYKDLTLTPIKKFPKSIRKQIKLKS
ncbi:DUF1080 domain-containing protein [Formosa sp. PL04]|uniref:3-keto-disaccharide hydrolase n=1 Tax=Formosa sp. PL04 TaxID=3081755 RepID=UPI0029824BFC|nr:DUF1080 domain-containing protein [Formosa sp. PL04]MDW5289465.1 DUF1080 domain-containing protein [Formosa sp. PL04]